jgi:site-specific DNA recombinase
MKADSLPKEPPRHAGIWIRVSTEDQAQGDGPKHHETRARHYAAQRLDRA